MAEALNRKFYFSQIVNRTRRRVKTASAYRRYGFVMVKMTVTTAETSSFAVILNQRLLSFFFFFFRRSFSINSITLAPSRPGDACKSFEFSCKDKKQCVFKSFLCDRENDCADGSDEIGCGIKI